ncbi:MAG: hypothetical protein K2J36_10585 [Ruminococcus sp.]|nr:hypothetical protein [Ruminococcus sp.]
MKQYLVKFVTKKGGEEDHEMLVMAENAKHAVEIAKEIWYSENTIHAFRMSAKYLPDVPETTLSDEMEETVKPEDVPELSTYETETEETTTEFSAPSKLPAPSDDVSETSYTSPSATSSKTKIIEVIIKRSVMFPDPYRKNTATVTYSTGVCRTYSIYFFEMFPDTVSRFVRNGKIIDKRIVSFAEGDFIVETYVDESYNSENPETEETVPAESAEHSEDIHETTPAELPVKPEDVPETEETAPDIPDTPEPSNLYDPPKFPLPFKEHEIKPKQLYYFTDEYGRKLFESFETPDDAFHTAEKLANKYDMDIYVNTVDDDFVYAVSHDDLPF